MSLPTPGRYRAPSTSLYHREHVRHLCWLAAAFITRWDPVLYALAAQEEAVGQAEREAHTAARLAALASFRDRPTPSTSPDPLAHERDRHRSGGR